MSNKQGIEKLGVVIVSYNSADELKKCIAAARGSIQESSFSGFIVVVDNNSRDGSVKISRDAGAEVIANKHNAGFAAAVNQGVRKAFSSGCTHILILNPDAVLTGPSISAMYGLFGQHDHVGAIGPRMLDAKGKPATDDYYLRAPSWISVMLFSTFLRPRSLKHHFLKKHFYQETGFNKDQTVEQVPGACILTSKEVLDAVGLLDEDFAIWYEDVEWCYRARKHGYKMWFCHSALVEHVGGVSFEKWQSLDKAVTFYVSMKTFFKKHKPLSYPLVVFVLTLNSLIMYVKTRDKSNLTFLKKFLTQKRGILPG